MIEGRPSETAIHVAAARAAHLRFDPTPHLLDDVHAETLLDEKGRALIETYSNEGPWVLVENRRFLPLRARWVEDRLAAAHARGVRQFVILGAGLDSFSFRQPTNLDGLRIFEIDYPSTQRWKLDRLASIGLEAPGNVRFVACDFEKTSVPEALGSTDFDASAPAVVSWMGVVYYLEGETVRSALGDLHDLLAPGSEVLFDVLRPWDELPERYHALRKQMAETLDRAGEPHITRYRTEEISALVRGAGFADAVVEEIAAVESRYPGAGRPDQPRTERFRLVTALR